MLKINKIQSGLRGCLTCKILLSPFLTCYIGRTFRSLTPIPKINNSERFFFRFNIRYFANKFVYKKQRGTSLHPIVGFTQIQYVSYHKDLIKKKNISSTDLRKCEGIWDGTIQCESHFITRTSSLIALKKSVH